MLQRYLILWLCLSSWIAYQWPTWFGTSVPDVFVLSKPHLGKLITVTMFAIGMMLPRKEVQSVLQRWPAVLGGTAIQYTAMPLLAWGLGTAVGLKDEYLIGIVMVGCVPGAMASNVLTLLAGGNTSYSVSLTTSATLLSPLIVPFTMAMALSRESIPVDVFVNASISLFLTVVIPVIVGYIASSFLRNLERPMKIVASTIANLAILWIIAAVVGLNRANFAAFFAEPSDPASRPPVAGLLTALIGINLGGYLCGYWGGKGMQLDEPMRRALTLEVGMQNAGLGSVLASQLFGNVATIPPALYTFGCMLTGSILARSWSSFAKPDADEPS